mmetsp:Transcript_41921/g.101022  ORF Transcript_41921/g.101022 Transcript_41921/m.101022 type:complete len:102 (-) Transcript_41921:3373-3678(-)
MLLKLLKPNFDLVDAELAMLLKLLKFDLELRELLKLELIEFIDLTLLALVKLNSVSSCTDLWKLRQSIVRSDSSSFAEYRQRLCNDVFTESRSEDILKISA